MTAPLRVNPYLSQSLPDDTTVKPEINAPARNNPYANVQQDESEPGFWGKLTNLGKNFFKLNMDIAGMGAGMDLDKTQILGNIVKGYQDGQAAQAAGLASSQVFSTKGLHDVAKAIPEAIGNAFTAIKNDPVGTVTSMPSALVSMATTPLNALSGVNFESPNADPLSMDQRVQSIKDTGALIAQTLVTGGASKLLAGTSDAAKLINAVEEGGEGAVTKEMLSNVKNPSKLKAIASTGTKGAIEGGLGGATYGFISGSGTDNQINKTVATGLMFAPLGAFVHTVREARPEFKQAENAADLASNISNWRQLQGKYNDSIKNIDTKASAIITSNDLADAVLKKNLSIDPKKPTIISGVDADKFDNVPKDLGYNIVTKDVGKGKVDALIVDKNSIVNLNDLSQFQHTGHYENEIVSYKGKTYTINRVSPTDASIDGMDGQAQLVPTKDLLRNDLSTETVEPYKALDAEYADWKKRLLDQNPQRVIPDKMPRIGPESVDTSPDVLSGDKESSERISDVMSDNPFEGMDNARRLAFGKFLAQDIMKEADPFDKAILQKAHLTSTPSLGTFEEFAKHAQTNGYKVEIGDGGSVIFRDMGDPAQRVVTTVNNINEGTSFIARTGQGFGNELVPLFSTPEPVENLGEPPNPNRPEPYGKFGSVEEWGKKYLTLAGHMANWIVQPDTFWKDTDNMLGTRFHAMLYDKTQAGKMAALAGAAPFIDKLSAIEKSMKGATLQDRIRMGDYLEAASPETMINEGFAREINPTEQALAKSLDDNDALANAFKLRSFLRDNPTGDVNAYKQQMGIDAKAETFNDILSAIENAPKDQLHMGMITALARKINGEKLGLDTSLDRDEFAKKTGMPQAHIDAAEKINDLTDQLADKFGIPKNELMQFWMTHARLYEEGNLEQSANLFARSADPKAEKFYGALARTGEIDTYERDPIEATKRYIMAGFNAEHFNDVEAEAKQYLEDTLRNKPEDMTPAIAVKIRMAGEKYLDDLRGRTPILSQASNDAADLMLNRLGNPKSLRDRVSSFLRLSFMGTQGAKIAAGVRDLMVTNGFLFSRYGPDVQMGVLDNAMTAFEKDHPLIRQGKVQGLSLEQISDPNLGADENFIKRMDAGKSKVLGDWLMKLSGQEQVYNTMKEGAYSYMYKKSADVLRKVASGDMEQNEVIKALDLDKNASEAVKTEVLRQLNESPVKYDAIAEYLARDFSRQVTPNYGLGNNPTGWRRTIGRVVGQYGAYPTWFLGAAKEAATTGTLGDKFMRAARAGIYTGAVGAASAATGFDFSPWYLHRAIFTGGPIATTAINVAKAMGPSGPDQRSAVDALKRLSPISTDPLELHRQFYIPGSFGIGNIANAVEQGNPLPALGINPQP